MAFYDIDEEGYLVGSGAHVPMDDTYTTVEPPVDYDMELFRPKFDGKKWDLVVDPLFIKRATSQILLERDQQIQSKSFLVDFGNGNSLKMNRGAISSEVIQDIKDWIAEKSPSDDAYIPLDEDAPAEGSNCLYWTFSDSPLNSFSGGFEDDIHKDKLLLTVERFELMQKSRKKKNLLCEMNKEDLIRKVEAGERVDVKSGWPE